jgi:hypothetical protein
MLAEFARNRRHQPGPDKREFYGELLGIARARQFKPGWAAHKFKEKYGDWPPYRHADPLPPSDATLRWVKSRNIAWAKSRRAAGQ